jgi:endoglucanase
MPPDEGIKTLSLEILKGLGECPAVSFMEGAVASYIQGFLQDFGLSVETDRHGNLITHLEGGNSSPEGQPPIAFMAHMDHPGFEAVEAREGMIIARALGGVPQACFSQGIPVQVVMPDGGRLLGETSGSYGRESERMIAIQLREPRNLEFPRPVVYDLPDFHFDGDMVRMRALDDLAGCASILVAMQTLASEERAGDVYGVFTRAEEVGLIGARLLAEDGRLPADTLVVSLESSRTLPGAVIGEGPVIRVGDATFTFDAEAEGALIKAREELTERRADFKAQRQLMSGGTCEASGFRYYGYRTTGIAFPLGNYHNATPEGGVGAEYIHIDDFVGGVELIVQAARSVARRRESRPWLRMRDIPQEYRQRLSETRDTF